MNKGTLIALGVFGVLLAVVLATRESHVNVGVPKLELPAIDKSKVVSLEMTGAANATLKKDGGSWWVIDPKKPDAKHPVEESQVNAALDALAEFRAPDFVTEKAEKHAEYELSDDKGLRVKVSREGAGAVELVFGKSAQTGGVYVREAGENAVFLTRSNLSWTLKKEPNGWRKRAFVNAKLDEMSKLTVRLPDASFTAKRGEDGNWSFDGTLPDGFRFDSNAVQRIAQQLTSLSAQEFVDASVSDDALGLSGPHAVLEAEFKDGNKKVLHLGLALDPQDSTAASTLQGQFDALDEAAGTKDGKLTRADLEKLSQDSGRPEAVRKAASRLVEDASTFARFAKDDALSAADLAAVVKTASTVPARLEGDPQVYLIPTYAAQGLRKKLDDLRDLGLLSFDSQKAQKVVVTAGGKKTVAVKEASGWKLVEPKTLPTGFEFDPAQVGVQLDMLRSTRASRYVPGVTDAKAGLTRPSAQVEIFLEGGGKQTLRFGAELQSPSGAKELYVKGSTDDLLYAIDPYLKSRLETGPELFKKPAPPPNFAGGGMRGLESLPPEVRRQLEAQLRQHQ